MREAADYSTEMRCHRHPYARGVLAREGWSSDGCASARTPPARGHRAREPFPSSTRNWRLQGVRLSGPCAPVIRRVIHATADFDFARALHFTPGAVEAGISALRAGAPLVLDTNMALAGVSQPSLARLGSAAHCLMAEEAVAQQARAEGTTRAVAAAGARRSSIRRRSSPWGTRRPPCWSWRTASRRGFAPPWWSACPWASSTSWRARSARSTSARALASRDPRHGAQGRQQRGRRHLQRAPVRRRPRRGPRRPRLAMSSAAAHAPPRHRKEFRQAKSRGCADAQPRFLGI